MKVRASSKVESELTRPSRAGPRRRRLGSRGEIPNILAFFFQLFLRKRSTVLRLDF